MEKKSILKELSQLACKKFFAASYIMGPNRTIPTEVFKKNVRHSTYSQECYKMLQNQRKFVGNNK